MNNKKIDVIDKTTKEEMDEFTYEFSERLGNLRAEKNYSLNDAVTKMQLQGIDITAKTLSHYERGNSKMDIYKLAKIAKFYSVSPDYLLNGTESKTDEEISRLINSVPKQLHPYLLNIVKGTIEELNKYCAEK